MEHSDIEHMAQGYPPSHIGKDHEEVVIELAERVLSLQQKLDAVLAEMSVVDAIHDECVFITDYDFDSCPKSVQKVIRSLAVMQIPATDAILNAVRAEGVEILTAKLQELIDEGVFDAKEIGVAAGAVHEGARIASQLRADATKGGSDDK